MNRRQRLRAAGYYVVRAKPKKLPHIDRFAEDTALFIGAHLHDDKWQEKLSALVEYRDDIPAPHVGKGA
jgi:hypothetical protein